MEVSYTLTAEDLRDYLRWSAEQPPAKRQQRRIAVLGTLVFFVLAAIFALAATFPGAGVFTLGAVFMLAGAVLVWFLVPLRTRRLVVDAAMAASLHGKTGYLLGSRTAKIDADGFALLGPGLLASYTWDLVDHIGVGRGVYVFLGTQQAHIVPASAFTNADEMRAFAEAAEGYVRAAETAAALRG